MGLSLLLASATSGVVSRLFVHPLDTLRSRLMVSTTNTTLSSTLRDILHRDGIPGLYRGFGISATMQAPAVATYLTTYDHAKASISHHTPLPSTSPATHLASGLVAETVSAVFWVPMEVIKQRAQVRVATLSASSSAAVARDLLAKEGPRALFKGYALTIGVFGPYAMVYFAAYERFKQMASSRSGVAVEELRTGVVAACAGGAGAIAGGLTTPLDVVKTRLQTQGDGGRIHYGGTWDGLTRIVREEGVGGVWRGVGARVLWLMPGTAITFTTFEFLKRKFALS